MASSFADTTRQQSSQNTPSEPSNTKPGGQADLFRVSDEQGSPPTPPARKQALQRRVLLRGLLFSALPLALIAGGYWYLTGGQVMSTENAYVEAEKVGIATDVAGIVSEIHVTENQHVDTGDILYRLDPSQFQIALDNARANLAQTKLSVAALKADYWRMLRDVEAEQAQVTLDQTIYDRNAALLKTSAVAKVTYDQAHFTLEADKSKLDSLRQQAQVQLARLGGSPDIPVERNPQYLQAKAQLDEAQRELDHSVVRAPFSGIVTNVPSIALGKYLAASTTAFYLVATDHVWIDSNPKETELTNVRPGQPVIVTVDTYPDLQWQGTVESISPAAAQEFELLPAQNTSGNWVKVVQRIPVRVRVDTSDKSRPALRAGMSVEINIDTGPSHRFPQFLTGLSGDTQRGAS